MRLSIIVPVYNMAADHKLEHCMDSLINQTIHDYEIIAVDDKSTDESLQLLCQYEKRCPDKVRVLANTQNLKQGGARNAGLGAACGEWVGFIDSDDWVTHDYYEKLLHKAEMTGADMVGCDYSLVTEYTWRPGRVVKCNEPEQTGVLDRKKHGSLFMRSGSMVIKIYRRSVIVENGLCFPEGIFYEDNCAGPLWSLYFTHFERVEEPLYYYYQHEASTVHEVTEEKCRHRLEAALLLYEECRSRGFLEEYHQEIEYRFTELYYVNTLFSYMLGVRRPGIAFVRELRKGETERFPNFQHNPYYKKNTRQEEQEMISLQARSDLLFYLYYRLKTLVRKWKKRRRLNCN